MPAETDNLLIFHEVISDSEPERVEIRKFLRKSRPSKECRRSLVGTISNTTGTTSAAVILQKERSERRQQAAKTRENPIEVTDSPSKFEASVSTVDNSLQTDSQTLSSPPPYSIATLQNRFSPQVKVKANISLVKRRKPKALKTKRRDPNEILIAKLRTCPFCQYPFKLYSKTKTKTDHIGSCDIANDLPLALIQNTILLAVNGYNPKTPSQLTLFDNLVGAVGACGVPQIKVIGVDDPNDQVAKVQSELQKAQKAQRRRKMVEIPNGQRLDPKESLERLPKEQNLMQDSVHDQTVTPPLTQTFSKSRLPRATSRNCNLDQSNHSLWHKATCQKSSEPVIPENVADQEMPDSDASDESSSSLQQDFETLRNALKASKSMNSNILRYQPIEFKEFELVAEQIGIKIGRETLRSFLNSESVSFYDTQDSSVSRRRH